MSREKTPKKKLTREDLRTFRRVLAFARPYAWRLVVGGVASVVGGGSLIAIFLVAQNLLSVLIDNNPRDDAREAQPAAIVAVVDETPAEAAAEQPSPRPSFVDRMTHQVAGRMLNAERTEALQKAGVKGLLAIGGIMLLIIAVNSVCQFMSMYYLGWVGQRVVMDLRLAVFRHLQELPVAFYNSTKAGDMISRVVADTQLLQSTVSNVIVDAIRDPAKLVMVLAYVLVLEWRLALAAIVGFPLVAVPIILIGQLLRRIGRDAQRRLADLTSVMKEALDGVAVVKAFGQEEREKKRFGALCHGFFRQMVRATK